LFFGKGKKAHARVSDQPLVEKVKLGRGQISPMKIKVKFSDRILKWKGGKSGKLGEKNLAREAKTTSGWEAQDRAPHHEGPCISSKKIVLSKGEKIGLKPDRERLQRNPPQSLWLVTIQPAMWWTGKGEEQKRSSKFDSCNG